jgi:C4-dicarboxylate-specific signal transduction histidine kinase
MHEINNPLNYATTGLFTLRKKAAFVAPEQQAAYNETLTDVEEGVKRVSAIVSDLRSFAHRDNESVEEVAAEEIISSALRFMSHELNEANVKVQQNVPTDQKLVVNRNKLIQVCVNLVQNSLDALKAKQFTGGEQPTVTIAGRVENGMSLLVFGDNGTGIKPELLDKIYDPFFTTKDVGDGMGMGLSICHRVVQEYGGHIRVKSEPGKFCEFTLEFPVKD